MRGLVMGVSDEGRAGEVRVDPFHDTAVAEAVFNFCMADGPELFLAFELDFA